MSSKLVPYLSPPVIRSSILKSPPENVPPTDELEALHAELKSLKQKSLERARKAGEDLKTIEESLRRMKEKEKGKAKATEKVKHERDCESILTVPRIQISHQRLPVNSLLCFRSLLYLTISFR
jgi:transcriptional adapter 3